MLNPAWLPSTLRNATDVDSVLTLAPGKPRFFHPMMAWLESVTFAKATLCALNSANPEPSAPREELNPHDIFPERRPKE